jgi:D-galactose 1-dehydrogenase
VKRVPIGIVGFGKIAQDQHLPAISASSDFQLVAIADPHASHPSLPSYTEIDDMLDHHPEIEAIALCTPPLQRADAALKVLEARKHVLLEKPPCATLHDAGQVASMAREQSVTLFAAWHSKFGAAVQPARHWLAGKDIRSIRIVWKEDVRVWHPGQKWIWQEGGFGVFDPGINALSILTELWPAEYKLVEALLSVPANCRTPIAAELSLSADDRVPVSAEFDFRKTGPQHWDIDIETDQGRLKLSLGGNFLEVDGVSQDVGEEAEYPAIYSRFHSRIQSGTSEIDLVPLRIVDDALTSGSVLKVEPFEE